LFTFPLSIEYITIKYFRLNDAEYAPNSTEFDYKTVIFWHALIENGMLRVLCIKLSVLVEEISSIYTYGIPGTA